MPEERSSVIRDFIRAARTDGVQRRSIAVAALVGTILNAINQGDVLLSGHAPDILKLALTYVVPYCVATYGGAGALMRRSGPNESDFGVTKATADPPAGRP
jgi:hypothetical protein